MILGLTISISGCYLSHWTKGGKGQVTPAAGVSAPASAKIEAEKTTPSTQSVEKKHYFQEYHTLSWKESVNLSANTDDEYYPKTSTITPRTLRRTIDEYYVPFVSEELNTVVDYYETLDTFDDTFLKKYHFDIRAVPEKETLNLMWKHKF